MLKTVINRLKSRKTKERHKAEKELHAKLNQRVMVDSWEISDNTIEILYYYFFDDESRIIEIGLNNLDKFGAENGLIRSRREWIEGDRLNGVLDGYYTYLPDFDSFYENITRSEVEEFLNEYLL